MKTADIDSHLELFIICLKYVTCRFGSVWYKWNECDGSLFNPYPHLKKMGNTCCGNRKHLRHRHANHSSPVNPATFSHKTCQSPHHRVYHGREYSDARNETDEEGYKSSSEGRTPVLAPLHHISERELDDGTDPSSNPTVGPMFKTRSKQHDNPEKIKKRRSAYFLGSTGTPSEGSSSGKMMRKYSSCSTIFVDDSTICQPNLRSTLKCVALAIYFHIKHREVTPPRTMHIFEEKLHPISRDSYGADYFERSPEHRHIYRFLRLLFSAAQLTAEVAIITLVYLERLLTYGELDISAGNWRRMLLGSVMLASKVWDDQAVWNVDYCQILRDVTVDDMNNLERAYLEALQFNINIPASVYAKYYFHLRDLAEGHPDLAQNKLEVVPEPLRLDKAFRLEALSRLKSVMQDNGFGNLLMGRIGEGGGVNNSSDSPSDSANGNSSSVVNGVLRRHRSNSVDNMAKAQNRRSLAILS